MSSCCPASRSTELVGVWVAGVATTITRFLPVRKVHGWWEWATRSNGWPRFRTIRETEGSMRSSPKTGGSGVRGVEMSSAIADEVARQLAAIRDGAVDLFGEDELRSKLTQCLRDGRPLRVKL